MRCNFGIHKDCHHTALCRHLCLIVGGGGVACFVTDGIESYFIMERKSPKVFAVVTNFHNPLKNQGGEVGGESSPAQ